MKKAISNIVYTVFCIALLALVFGAGYYMGTNNENGEIMAASDSADYGAQLPGETVVSVITEEDIEVQLHEIGELSTYIGEYTVEITEGTSRHILDDISIPLTQNLINLKCTGNVKVGYDLDDIDVRVDNASKKVYISLPEPEVKSNYIIWDTIEYSEKNNVLNPIQFSQYKDLIGKIEEDGLQQAEDDGIYNSAEENLKNIIVNYLGKFDDYEIVFM